MPVEWFAVSEKKRIALRPQCCAASRKRMAPATPPAVRTTIWNLPLQIPWRFAIRSSGGTLKRIIGVSVE